MQLCTLSYYVDAADIMLHGTIRHEHIYFPLKSLRDFGLFNIFAIIITLLL